LESMMRRVGLSVPSSLGTASTPGLRLRSKASQGAAAASNLIPQTGPIEPVTPARDNGNSDRDSDSDSLDEINNTAHPSAAFLMASAQASRDSDDSFGSSNHSSDSLNEEDANLAPVHPFARGVEDNGFEDSFDSFDGGENQPEEETLFGVPPEQRIRIQGQRLGQAGPSRPPGDELRMLGEDLLQDTIGVGAQIAMRGGIEASPTPAPQWTATE